MTFQQTIEWANARGVGQFHVFDRELNYRSTWRSYGVACSIADKLHLVVANDSGEIVYRAK